MYNGRFSYLLLIGHMPAVALIQKVYRHAEIPDKTRKELTRLSLSII